MYYHKENLQWACRAHVLDLSKRPLIMGILNVTPDSFSDGGRHAGTPAAVEHGCAMVAAGADLIDVGGESTRPGAREVPEDEELARVIPVIEHLAARTRTVISIDTMKAGVARRAIEAGAHIINDVSALTHDPDMVEVARDSRAGVVLMHMQGAPRTMQDNPRYANVVHDVRDVLRRRVDDLTRAGLAPSTMAIDPGIGFGKTVDHNVQLLRHLDAFTALGPPVVVGLSRKQFLGRLTGRPVDERLPGSLAALVCAILKGAHIMRVHDVAASVDAVRVAMALEDEDVGLD